MAIHIQWAELMLLSEHMIIQLLSNCWLSGEGSLPFGQLVFVQMNFVMRKSAFGRKTIHKKHLACSNYHSPKFYADLVNKSK